MNRRPHPALASWGTMVLVVLLAGCDEPASGGEHAAEHEGHESGHPGDRDDAPAPARLETGGGLRLEPATAAAMGVQTATVESRQLTPSVRVSATVFDAGPPARAVAWLPRDLAAELDRDPSDAARVLSSLPQASDPSGRIEIVLALPGGPSIGTTIDAALSLRPRTTAATVPLSAVLRTATGTFVYVDRDGPLVRTPVQAGASDGAVVEITTGLRPGDRVAVSGVEQLWLTELHLTTGGGHGH